MNRRSFFKILGSGILGGLATLLLPKDVKENGYRKICDIPEGEWTFRCFSTDSTEECTISIWGEASNGKLYKVYQGDAVRI